MEVIEHHRATLRAAGPRASLFERAFSRRGVAWSVLCAAVSLTALAWWVSLQTARDETRAQFERRTDDLHARLRSRLETAETLLRGGAGLFAASGQDVPRSAWKSYVDSLRMDARVPGVQGLGVSQWFPSEQLGRHERNVRAEGFPDYQVRPVGVRDAYSAVVFLEPFDDRNQRAFGYDMFSEWTRRHAMSRARDSGEVAASGIVTLVQENGSDVQKGFLVYLALYQGGRLPPTEAERRETLWGWVYAPFRVGDLMDRVADGSHSDLDFSLHDSVEARGDNLFYTSLGAAEASSDSALTRQRELVFGGRTWTVVYHASASATWSLTRLQPTLVAVAGLTVDLLLFGMISVLARRKRLAEREVGAQAAEVQARTAWLDAVSGLSPDGVLVFERDGAGVRRLVFTNPAFSELFGLRPEELLGLSEPAADEWLSGLATSGTPMAPLAPGDALLQLAGPPPRVLRRRAREDSRQRVYYFRDVTHETEVERLKNEFLTTAAHELRTPLASVYGFSELLLSDRVPATKRANLNAIVHRQAGVLKHLVDELLDLARIDARGDSDFVREPCDLRAVAESAAESLLRPDEPVRVRLHLGDEPLWVDADAAKIQQAIVNGLTNAQKYSPSDRPIDLRLARERRHGSDGAVLRVSDQGIGMSPEQCARAFERFYRADPSGHILGAGLGLAIIQEVIALHGGEVHLNSQAGVGTELALWLPLGVPGTGIAPQPAPMAGAEHVTS